MPDEQNDRQASTGKTTQTGIWLRLAYMIAFAIIWNVAVIVLVVAACLQFVVTLFTGKPNGHLMSLGRDLAVYLGQIVRFETFATEDLAFPFASWPKGSAAVEAPSEQPVEEQATKVSRAKRPSQRKTTRKTAPKDKPVATETKAEDKGASGSNEEGRQ